MAETKKVDSHSPALVESQSVGAMQPYWDSPRAGTVVTYSQSPGG